MNCVAFWHLYLPGIMIIHPAVRNTSYRSLDSVLMLNAPHKIGSITIYLANLRINPSIDHHQTQKQVYVGSLAVITHPPSLPHITRAPAPARVRAASRAVLEVKLAASRVQEPPEPSTSPGTASSSRPR